MRNQAQQAQKPPAPLTPEQRKLIREAADGKETVKSLHHRLKATGYKGSIRQIEPIFLGRRERLVKARSVGPLLVKAIEVEDMTTDLLNDVVEAVWNVEEDNPAKVRELVASVSALESAFNDQRGGPEFMKRRLTECIELLELYGERPELTSKVAVVFPVTDEPDEEVE